MKVYARYFEEEGLSFRRDTILQFGNSWELIGSIILINPGSAVPLSMSHLSQQVLDKLLPITQTNDSDSWKEFSIDPTMRQIERLFSGKFVGQNKPLNGVIQLFNLFNLRNANLIEALELFKTTSNPNIISIETDIARIGEKPVYFGWGNVGKQQLKNIAKRVFESVPLPPYLNEKFENNFFYHPRYLQMGHRSNGNVIEILHHFYGQHKKYKLDSINLGTKYLDASSVMEKFKQLLLSAIDSKGVTIKSDNSTTRIFFQDKENNELEFIVTKADRGYSAIRYNPKAPIIKDNSTEYLAIGKLYLDVTEDFKNDKNGKWFCRKSFKYFNMEEDELAAQLIEAFKGFLSLRKNMN